MVGKRIQQRRKELGISASALCRRIGKDRSTLYRYENGDIENMPLDILEPIAEALKTTPAYLMGWENEKDATNNGSVSEKRQALIDFAKSVPEDKADMILRVMKSILENS